MAKDKDSALKALALRMGASVRLSNGELFNSTGDRVTALVETPVEGIKEDRTEQILQSICDLLANQKPPNVVVPQASPPQVVVEAPKITVQPTPVPKVVPTSWKFTFERNESGTIRSITATPTL